MKSFDLIVIGGGSGGLAAAQRAAEYGARVVVFEAARLGGTCVNVGCVPKKVMWYAAEISTALNAAADYGFAIQRFGHDFKALKTRRDAYIARLNGIYAKNLERRGVMHVAHWAQFVEPHVVADAGGQHYTAPHVLIATGGQPLVPAIPGAEQGITSDGFFELDWSQPASKIETTRCKGVERKPNIRSQIQFKMSSLTGDQDSWR